MPFHGVRFFEPLHYSLIGTAKLDGLDPEAYLRYAISNVNEHPITKLNELLPWHVAEKLKAGETKGARPHAHAETRETQLAA